MALCRHPAKGTPSDSAAAIAQVVLLLNAAVLTLCLLCRGAAALHRPYIFFLLANPAARLRTPAYYAAESRVRRALGGVHVVAARVGGVVLVVYVLLLAEAGLGGGGSAVLLVWRLLAGVWVWVWVCGWVCACVCCVCVCV